MLHNAQAEAGAPPQEDLTALVPFTVPPTASGVPHTQTTFLGTPAAEEDPVPPIAPS